MAEHKVRYSTGEKAFNVFNVLFIGVLMFVCVYPFWHILMSSVSQGEYLLAHRGMMWTPVGTPGFAAYKAVFKNPNILTGYRNTLFVVVVGVSINLLLTILGAFFLSRKGLMWRNLVMFLIVFTMYFSGGLIPLYFTVRALKINNTLFSLILPTAINTTNLIIMRTAFSGIPDSLEESARLDGASAAVVLFRVMVPLAMPTIAVITLYYAVAHWNAWFHAMLFISKREMYPLQLILREILIQNDTASMTVESSAADAVFIADTIKNAIIIVATVPILVLYPFLQRYFVTGVMIGSIKE